jgi:dipeptidyl aminopeptidase/acylaminoacyl peptidase
MITYAAGAFSFHKELPVTLLQRSTFFNILPLALVGSPAAASDKGRVPTIDDLLSIKSVGSVVISPDGKWVAYTVSQTDFKGDAFINHIWIADLATGRKYQLTRGEKSAGNPAWSPASQWLAFTSNPGGDKNQIFAIPPNRGEAVQLTKVETNGRS